MYVAFGENGWRQTSGKITTVMEINVMEGEAGLGNDGYRNKQ